MITDFRNLRVTVMGLGKFGGGIGAVRFLAHHGARVTVTDTKPASLLAEPITQIADCPHVIHKFGGHQDVDFRDTDLVVASPAVDRAHPCLEIARTTGIPVTSEMNLFWERNRGKTVCVTGSNGKSTTVALIHALLQAGLQRSTDTTLAGTPPRAVWLGGNIGHSLLPVVEQIQPDDWVVLELSSFQLDDLAVLKPNPHVAVVTNFTPNHLDRHHTVDAYRQAKQNLLRWQTADRVAILNQNDADVAHWPTAARTIWFGRDDEGRQGLFAIGLEGYKRQALYRHGSREQVLPLGLWFNLPGIHNFMNALAATSTALILGSQAAKVETGLRTFRPLPHRLQLVAETAGRRFYNDSKATTPEATMLALRAFREPIVLLAGGSKKGVDLAPLAAEILARHVKAVALLGETGPELGHALHQLDTRDAVRTHLCTNLQEAWHFAVAQSQPGDIVLLSPGCASYDWFPNYEVRGEEFTRLARTWDGR
ncbi:MAG: UDP-N-acetylmuramoyl-L-alanine--D-glutamate ligase [Planctomycetes bacterium]|nr:UDP-N-acetylmuramoyl-L-alanine--D-glutamate ligase [Planctomycetota bacterium]